METPIYYPFFLDWRVPAMNPIPQFWQLQNEKKHISIISGSTASRSCRNLQRQIRPTAASKLS